MASQSTTDAIEDMRGMFMRRVVWAVVALAGLLGSLTPMPGQAAAAWDLGTPIVGYWNGPGTLLWGEHFGALDDAAARQLVSGGFNVALANTYQEVQIAQSHGLRTMFQSDLFTPASLDGGTKQATLDATIAQLRQSSAHYGYMVKDEPNASEFVGLGQLVNYLRQHDPNHVAYINLLPNYADNTQLGANGYSAYLSQFDNSVSPSILAYDHYQYHTTYDGSGYLQNLASVAQSAKQAGIPFINTVQACSWDTATMRVPNAVETRFLIYSTLAYGAQGISYFQYTEADAPQIGGIVRRDGTPMPIYPTIEAGNREFVNVARQYQGLKWIGTYLKGYRSYAAPPGTEPLPVSSSFTISSGISGLPTTMTYHDGNPLKGVLLGLFDADGSSPADATFALVLNMDYSGDRNYTVTGPGNLSVFDPGTGRWIAMNSNQISLDLAAGGGLLVGLTSAIPVPEPSAIALVGPALAALLLLAIRRKSQPADA
jgi:hypothetical protein